MWRFLVKTLRRPLASRTRKRRRKTKEATRILQLAWVEANVADTHDGFGLSLGDVASGGFTVEGSQPEARNPRRVSFSDDPPESRTFKQDRS